MAAASIVETAGPDHYAEDRHFIETIRVIRDLERQLEPDAGARSRSIARDLMLTLHHHPAALHHGTKGQTVQQLAYILGTSLPTARLACRRLAGLGLVQIAARSGRSEIFALTPAGLAVIGSFAQALRQVGNAAAPSAP